MEVVRDIGGGHERMGEAMDARDEEKKKRGDAEHPFGCSFLL